MKTIFEEANGPAEWTRGYATRMTELLADLDADAVAAVIDAMDRASHEGRTIFVVANGGSSAVASHLVNDLGPNSLVPRQSRFRVYSLSDNVESLTAIANDSGYENVFAYQLQANLEPGDLVLAMSVSGNSPNLVRALEYAKENGALTIAWTGFDGGKLAGLADLSVRFPSSRDEYGPVEDMFAILVHVVAGYLAMKRGRNLHH
ncbi:MAG TPA: SIS domain-containing protein [Longimicrobium sp.]|nr:SIS domain-containing protein [Longimicrobium sp.]